MDKSKLEKSPSGIRPGVIVAAVAVVGILIAVIFAGRLQKQASSETAQAPPQVEPSTPQTAPVTDTRQPGLRSLTPVPATSPNTVPGVATATPGPRSPLTPPGVPPTGDAAAPAATGEMLDWNDKLDNILGSNDDETVKAEQLLALWPSLPEDGQVETMQHISNLLPDEKFSVLVQTLTNAATSEAVLDIILGDALNRPNALKLPSLLQVAQVPGHPKAEEALEILEVFVDHNYGTDWAKWDKAVKDWLKENPDEPEDRN